MANMTLEAVMQRLYDSEINCSVSSQWDGGWDVQLGDERNGWKASAVFHPSNGTNPETYEIARRWLTLADAGVWLDQVAREHYPESDYAKRLVCCHLSVLKATGVGLGLGEITRCFDTAEYAIYGRTGTPDDYTHACSAHVGALLGDAPGHRLVTPSFQVKPICGVCRNEDPEEHPNPQCAGCSPWSPEGTKESPTALWSPS